MHREGEDPQVVPAKCEGIKVSKGDLLYFNTWGGGGWGDPLERDPELVLTDINRRLVSIEGAPSIDTRRLLISVKTSSGSLSSGSPHPPPPQVLK